LSIAKYYKRKKGKKISTHYSKGLPPLRIVRDQMVQVFLNLILNAMDATDEGGLIEITTTYEDGYIRVDLRDDGHGITEDNQAKIFQPYFTTKATGTGLGLFVCKKLVQQSAQGRISMCSSTGVGTTFTVCLKPDEVSAPASPNDPLSSVKISTS
jgi:signal transduction histidine kinase